MARSEQFQLDVFGEVAAALARMPEAEEDIRVSCDRGAGGADRSPVRGVAAAGRGHLGDARRSRKHFMHSKVMAWVALDRAIKHYERVSTASGDVKRWKKNRDMIHRGGLREGLRQEAEQLCAVVRIEGAGCIVPADRAGRLSAAGRSADCGDGGGDREAADEGWVCAAVRHEDDRRWLPRR